MKKAAALKYDLEKQRAPKVIAKGKGNIAQQIIEIAKANDVAVFESPELVQALESLDLETEIPIELYESVAELFAWLMKINR